MKKFYQNRKRIENKLGKNEKRRKSKPEQCKYFYI